MFIYSNHTALRSPVVREPHSNQFRFDHFQGATGTFIISSGLGFRVSRLAFVLVLGFRVMVRIRVRF